MKYYVLQDTTRLFDFRCYSRFDSGLEAFEKRIEDFFWNWKAIQVKGNNLTLDDFMKDFKKVIIEITDL